MKLKAILTEGTMEGVFDTVSLPDINAKGRAIPGTDRIVASRVREVIVKLTFVARMSESDANQLFNQMRDGGNKPFTIRGDT